MSRNMPYKARSAVTWSHPAEAIALFLRGRTARAAVPTAAIVGTVLSLVNQTSVVLESETTWATWVRMVTNYAIPYCVASVGYLAAHRQPRSRPVAVGDLSVSNVAQEPTHAHNPHI